MAGVVYQRTSSADSEEPRLGREDRRGFYSSNLVRNEEGPL
jgi:hypothetical protein